MHAIRTVAIKALAKNSLFAATVHLETHNMIEQLSVLPLILFAVCSEGKPSLF
ncbi:hypothetical protein Awo_c26870 [Acetobacterium woodii DSM 1030]|uniref:Uncharacterized protein n=1 Tax=Acetobacterium woodii (strain ATCC 29683 / DSM 1030 / JCM 2381 / KCTC 1655 / WB1) TaxID=931626 RepID=H6LFF3_ACEWD|nr:hypothetical protein Awo_c26870 [Acetobacterium woodii DSM 1030]